MKSEQQVPLIKTCEKIKGVGINLASSSIWWWGYGGVIKHTVSCHSNMSGNHNKKIPAPTATELMLLLPAWANGWELIIYKETDIPDNYCIQYFREEDQNLLHEVENASLVEALAQMLIWMSENNHLDS